MKMRRYDIISGILLILSIIDFALAAPVSVQEKRQETLKDVTTVLGKRGDEVLVDLGKEYFKTWEKPVASSSTHSSSSSVASGPDPGSTNAVQPPAPNAASSTANPDPLTDPSSCPSGHGLQARGNCFTSSLDEGYEGGSINDFSSGFHAPLPMSTSGLELSVFTPDPDPFKLIHSEYYWEPAPWTQ